MTVFGILTIRALHQRHTGHNHVRQKDRDLMRMLIAEIFINISTSITFSANLLYGTATFFVTDKTTIRIEIEVFVNFLSQFLIHLLSVAPFYLFIISTRILRGHPAILVQVHLKTCSCYSNAHWSKFNNDLSAERSNHQKFSLIITKYQLEFYA